MSNGHVCCLLGVCCPPGSDAALQSLTEEIFGGVEGIGLAQSAAVAKWLLDGFDLVPKGVGAAIVAGYEGEFKKKHGS